MGITGAAIMTRMRRFVASMAAVAAIAYCTGVTALLAAEEAADDPWPGLVRDAFNGRAIDDGSSILALDLPYPAADAAIVPLSVRTTLPVGDPRRVNAITIVIDRNPAPVAATFKLG